MGLLNIMFVHSVCFWFDWPWKGKLGKWLINFIFIVVIIIIIIIIIIHERSIKRTL